MGDYGKLTFPDLLGVTAWAVTVPVVIAFGRILRGRVKKSVVPRASRQSSFCQIGASCVVSWVDYLGGLVSLSSIVLDRA